MLRLARGRSLWLGALVGLLVAAGCGGGSSGPMETYRGMELKGPAPDFRLTDQDGETVALSDLRGPVVVLTFMDTRCDETCPLTALELLAAHQALGEAAGRVVFLGVNVNATFNRREDVEASTVKFKLGEIPTWHFLTGTAEALAPVWKAYFVAVRAQPGEEDFAHTPGVYVIDQEGALRWYLSTPLQDELASEWTGPRLSELLVDRVRELVGK